MRVIDLNSSLAEALASKDSAEESKWRMLLSFLVILNEGCALIIMFFLCSGTKLPLKVTYIVIGRV